MYLKAKPKKFYFAPAVFGAAAVAPPSMLDGIATGLKCAFSTRKLLTAYAGSAIRVQRVSDNAQQDIGFSSGVLDTGALATFCSGTTGRVVTWYDQSGSGFNLTAPAFANAPPIYQSGAVKTLNGQPALFFDQIASSYLLNATMSANPTNTLYTNFVGYTTAGAGVFGWSSDTSSALGWQVNGTNHVELDKINAVSIIASTGTVPLGAGVIIEVQYNSVSGAASIWVNRSASGTATSAQSLTAGKTQFGAHLAAGGFWDGPVGEALQYDLVGGIPGASQTSIVNNQHSYWGTP